MNRCHAIYIKRRRGARRRVPIITMKNQKVINLLLDAKKSLEGIGDRLSSHIAAHKIEQSLFELGAGNRHTDT